MVPFLYFIQHIKVLVQLLLGKEGGAVDALQHLPLLVAAPIRAGGMEQLEVLQVGRIRHVRPAAKVGEAAVGVRADHLVGPLEASEALDLERVVGKDLPGLGLRHLGAHERQLLGRHLPHLGLERLEILGCERLLDFEVVIEAVVDGGTETDLRVGTQPAHRRREHMRSRMAQHLQRARILLGDDRECPALPQRRYEVLDLPVNRDGDGRQQQAGADGGHDVLGEGARRDLSDGAIGKCEGQQRHQ